MKRYQKRHHQCSNISTCPTWFICNSDKRCLCGNGHNYAVVCDDVILTSAVLDCHCVTYDGDTESTYLGACFYNCENQDPKDKDKDVVYNELPTNPQSLTNRSVCHDFHRTGTLCGDCEHGYSPFVLSYNLSCVKCPDGHKNWWKFILVAFVPMTLFYFIVVFFMESFGSVKLCPCLR